MEFKRLDELQIEIIDGDRGKNYPNGDDFKKDKYCLFLNAKNVTINGFNFSETMFIDKDKDAILRKGKLKRDDIVLTTRGTVGNVAYYSSDITYENVRINSGMVILRCDKNSIIPEYLYYVLKSNFLQKQINNIKSGSAQPQLPISTLKNLKITFLNIDLQKRVIKILKEIDKKIKLNNQINNNLHNIGLTYYKEWLRILDDSKETTYKEFKELGKIVMGQSPKGESYNYNNIGLPLINGAADYEDGYLKAQKYTSMPSKICKKNDLIFCIRATIGLLTICDKEYCLGRGVASITDINDNYKEYAYYLINNSIEEFKKLATGSVIIGISKDDIGNIKVKLPTDEQIEHFHNIQKPFFEKIRNIRLENRALINMRDTLLQKLTSGEIDLTKIEM